jgi:iron complex outermembrane receptor protein
MAERVDDGSQRLTPLPFNPAFAGDPFRVNSDLRGRNETERYQLSLHGRKDFDWGTMKSITSYQSWDLGPQTVDLDLSPGSFATSLINQDQDLWTQEFRFQCPEDVGPLSWRGGLFYMNKENNGSTRRMFPAGLAGIVTEGNRFTIEEKNYAAYGKAAYDLGNGFSVEAGGRLDYTDASMSRVKALAPFGPVPAQSPNSDGIYFSPTTGIVYAHNDNVSAFLRTGLGIKPHGYSAFSDNPATASFGEERNWSNEAGVQYNDPDSNLNVVVRAFWNVIDDYQLNAQNPLSTDFVIVNADEVRSRGLEAELQWRPIDPLLIHGNAGWTDVEFESYTDPFTGMNHDGSNVPFIPELTASAGFRYDLPGGFFFGSSVRATEDTYYDAANTGAFLQDGYWIWNAQAGYEADNWSVTVYGRNILDEEYYTFINPQIAAGSPGDPQLFGVRVNLDLW